MIYLTSDLHFSHLNILKYEADSRPFDSVEEMNRVLIENWNNTITDADTVYVVGDFFMGPHEEIHNILPRLHGKIILVRGNHDTKDRLKIYRDYGIEIQEIEYLEYKGRFFILCHFPIASDEFKRMVHKDLSEVICCYGHIHHNAPTGYVDGTYHVGVDTNNLTPVSIEKIWQEAWPSKEEVGAEKYFKIMEYKNEMETIYEPVYYR